MKTKVKFILACVVIVLVTAYIVLKHDSLPASQKSTDIDTFLANLYEYAKEEMPQLSAETARLIENIQQQMKQSPDNSNPSEKSITIDQEMPKDKQLEQQKQVADEKYLREGLEAIRKRLQNMDSEELAAKIKQHFQVLYNQNMSLQDPPTTETNN